MKYLIKFFTLLTVIIFFSFNTYANDKIKIGLVVPLSGEFKNLGDSILKSVRLAINDIDDSKIVIIPKDSKNNPDDTFEVSQQLYKEGVKIIIGPIFKKNTIKLDALNNDLIFLSFTNKIDSTKKNIISAGVNSISQFNAIKKFQTLEEIERSYLFAPNNDILSEIKTGVKKSKIKLKDKFYYDQDPTLITKQIEDVTRYRIRKQNLLDEIKRVEESDLFDKEQQLEKLEKKYTIGDVNFDSVIISDFDESLKSVITSLLYTDVSPKKKFIITFNQWFDESLLEEKTIQPIYYPSIDKENLENFKKKYYSEFNEYPNYLALLSYDLIGLIYYLSLNNELIDINKIFKKKNSFKGKIGIFEIENNKINHKLNFYQINEGLLKKIF